MRGKAAILAALLGLLALYLVATLPHSPAGREKPPVASSWRHEAYVWNHDWSSARTDSLPSVPHPLAALWILDSELSLAGAHPRLQVIRRPDDPKAPVVTHSVVRISGTRHDWLAPGAPGEALLLERLAHLSRQSGFSGTLQLDYDCPESRLQDYAQLLQRLKKRLPHIRWSVTTLPSWLDRVAFRRLLDEVDEHVLQVHSLELPRSYEDPLTLMEPSAALRAAQKAGWLGRPFRVALPTFSAAAVFHKDGTLDRLIFQPPAMQPASGLWTMVHADPRATTAWLQELRQASIPGLTGIVWFRLSLGDEPWNWTPQSLSEVAQGKVPTPSSSVTAQVFGALAQIAWRNTGQTRLPLPSSIRTGLLPDEPLQGDGHNGYRFVREDGLVRWRRSSAEIPRDYLPGSVVAVGWIRLPNNLNERLTVFVEEER